MELDASIKESRLARSLRRSNPVVERIRHLPGSFEIPEEGEEAPFSRSRWVPGDDGIRVSVIEKSMDLAVVVHRVEYDSCITFVSLKDLDVLALSKLRKGFPVLGAEVGGRSF